MSLDDGDNDPSIFFDYMTAAVESTLPGTCAQTRALLDSSQLPSFETLVNTFINEMGRVRRPLLIVLDDYHAIHDAEIHKALVRFIRYQPRQVHLMVLTRSDPPLSLAGLRARAGQMSEIRAHDLRFTSDETRTFVSRTAGVKLDAASLDLLGQKTEGWVAGLRLASLSMRGRERPEAFVAELQGTHRHIMAYLLDEVLSQQPHHVQDFLLRTSILDRFCADLCESLASPRDTNELTGQDFISWLERVNLFIVPLDDTGTWYRYHHLFQDLLRHKLCGQLDAEAVRWLHRSASAWFARKGLVEEGVHHALAADEPIRAAELVEDHVLDVIHREEWRRLKRWMDVLPEDVIASRPQLLIAKAWSHYVLHISGPHVLLPLVIEAQKLLLQTSTPQASADLRLSVHADGEQEQTQAQEQAVRKRWILGSIAIFMAEECLSRNDVEGAADQARRALTELPERYLSDRGTAVNLLSQASVLVGQHDVVIAWISDELLRHEGRADHYPYTVRLPQNGVYRIYLQQPGASWRGNYTLSVMVR